jgi:membrane fusion protein (multidrug efflux system)
LGAGTGSAFSLLPAQNATGNWIKVVQRLPVRVALDPRQLSAHPLRVGLSMTATVDIHDQSGKMLADAPRPHPVVQTAASVSLEGEADAAVTGIVAANLGRKALAVTAPARPVAAANGHSHLTASPATPG